MGLADVTADAVLAAVSEYDDLGQDRFLAQYGFGRARKFVLVHQGRSYDSKAILGAAHQLATGQPLTAQSFNGGDPTVGRLVALGFDVRDTSVQAPTGERGLIGEVPGMEAGATFDTRREAAAAGVHRPLQAGIAGTKMTGAESIVVSGGYEDDEDNGSAIIYTGHGGQENGRQVADQSFDSPGNAALVTSKLASAPVRVIRGAHRGSVYAPQVGYRYDGLFLVQDSWRERGRSGFLVCRYRLVALDTAVGDVLVQGTAAEPEIVPVGNVAPERVSTTSARLVRSAGVAQYVKSAHDHTCQTCGTRLNINGRGHSEAAHIRALGRPHVGPDVPQNVLCLCPNCHVMFDNGALLVGPDMNVVINRVPAGALRMHPSHVIDPIHLEYHRSVHQ